MTQILRRRRRTLAQQDARTGLVLMSPTLLIVLAAVVIPLLWSVLISFQRLKLIQIGVADPFSELTTANFTRVLGSQALWSSLRTTFFYTAGSVVCSVALGLVAARVAHATERSIGGVRAGRWRDDSRCRRGAGRHADPGAALFHGLTRLGARVRAGVAEPAQLTWLV